jgi:hypothetical protein
MTQRSRRNEQRMDSGDISMLHTDIQQRKDFGMDMRDVYGILGYEYCIDNEFMM